ncbi:MAG: hypothetical protein JJ979_25990, partial [Roseibium sp.]|nr:hypothetical protein [Roseibium sp.]
EIRDFVEKLTREATTDTNQQDLVEEDRSEDLSLGDTEVPRTQSSKTKQQNPTHGAVSDDQFQLPNVLGLSRQDRS